MSAPSTPKAADGIASLTARELEVLSKAWGCLKSGPPDIDYEKLAAELSMANHRSAANAWGAIKKKMASTWATTGAPSSAKSSSVKRKKVVKTNDDSADSADSDVASPVAKKARSKLPRSPRKRGKATTTGAGAGAGSVKQETRVKEEEGGANVPSDVDV